MATLRDKLLPVVSALRVLPQNFGMRRFAVTVRRRTWSTLIAGEGTATNWDIQISPAPRVHDVTARDLTVIEAEMAAANRAGIIGNMYRITGITPQYTKNGVTGGYLSEQIRLWPNVDAGAVENLVSLVGDDGYLRECEQVTFDQSRPFGYGMLVKEIDRPRSSLQSIALTSSTGFNTLVHGTTLQYAANGTFNGGATSYLTTICAWSSSNTAVATVDPYGKVTGLSAGTTTLSAASVGITGAATVTVT